MLFYKTAKIRSYQYGLLFLEGEFSQLLAPGHYNFFDPFNRIKIDITDTRYAWFAHPEIEEIVKAYKNGFFGPTNQNGKIGLLGHSRGGGDSIIASSLINEISALTTWSAISKFDRWTSRQKDDWKKTGFLSGTK